MHSFMQNFISLLYIKRVLSEVSTNFTDNPRLLQVDQIVRAKTEVPRDVRNSKFRKQDKFRRDWSQY